MRHATIDGRGQRGFTLVEMAVVAVILVLLMSLVSGLIRSGSEASKLSERKNRATEIAQDLIDGVRNELRSAVRLFTRDATGLAYRSRLEDWTGIPPLATSTLPELAVGDTIRKDDASTTKTGNELLFVRHAWSSEFLSTTGLVYRYDVYRFLRYFEKVEGKGPTPGSPTGINLVRWVGEPLVDGSQVDGIANASEQQQVLRHLLNGTADRHGATHPKVQVVWQLGQDPGALGTFRQILATGSMTTSPVSPRAANWTIERDERLSAKSLLAYRHYSIATNYSLASYAVPKFGIADNTGSGFPHGFEVQVIGPSSARQVLLRLVVVSTNNAGHKAHAEGQAVIAARDL